MSHRLTPLAASLPATVPFVGPEAMERAAGRPFAARLGANESVFGPSPAALAAMEAAARGAWMYGDPEAFELRAALAARHGVPMAAVVVGAGIDGLLGLLVRLLVSPGDAVVTSEGAYPTFAYHAAGYGARLLRVPYAGDREDVGALVARGAEAGAKLIYLANPDNPMGTVHGAEAVRRAVEAVPEGALLVLDEAYADCAPEGDGAAVRRSRAPGDPDADLLQGAWAGGAEGGLRGRPPGPDRGVRTGAQPLRRRARGAGGGAGGAWRRGAPGGGGRAHRRSAGRDRAHRAGRAGLRPLPSAANFVAIDCGGDGALARAVLAGLAARGVFARMPGGAAARPLHPGELRHGGGSGAAGGGAARGGGRGAGGGSDGHGDVS